MTELLSRAPYFFRAHYDWLLDNHLTPHLLLNPQSPGTQVPEHLRRGQALVLNLAPRAIQNLLINQTGVHFSARFQGMPFQVMVPWPALVVLYALERPQESELFFQSFMPPTVAVEDPPEEPPPKPPQLRRVK
jgi:stringent starvation protein B